MIVHAHNGQILFIYFFLKVLTFAICFDIWSNMI